MESNRRKQLETYRTKLTIFESIVDTINDTTGCSFGKKVYDCTQEELDAMNWSEKCDHYVYDGEGLQKYEMPYPDRDEDNEYEKERNKTYELAREAYMVARNALEKWLDK